MGGEFSVHALAPSDLAMRGFTIRPLAMVALELVKLGERVEAWREHERRVLLEVTLESALCERAESPPRASFEQFDALEPP